MNMSSGPFTSWQIKGENVEAVTYFIFFWGGGHQNHCDGKFHESKFRQYIKKQRHNFADKGLYSQSYDFSNSCVWPWVLDDKEGWALKNWCFWVVVLEKTVESPLDSKEIKDSQS